jgi:hypothetical protein
MNPWSDNIDLMRTRGVGFEVGLTAQEVLKIEYENSFQFPEDLRTFLMSALPVAGGRFPHWRRLDKRQISGWMTDPFEGIAFDIEHNSFWLATWGPRPAALAEAFEIARAAFDRSPKLIPIVGHRFMPAQPTTAGNPVFSVHQTDIIYYGLDLQRYLACEFGGLSHADAVRGEARRISFWTDLVEANE